MRYLLDTNVFLWAALGDRRLSPSASAVLADGTAAIHLSAVSAAEIAIKYAAGRLELPDAPEVYIPSRMALFKFQPLAISVEHALGLAQLPMTHRDPFDRLLIAQARVEGIPVVTSDQHFARYDVEVVW